MSSPTPSTSLPLASAGTPLAFADRRLDEVLSEWAELGPRDQAESLTRALYRLEPEPWTRPHLARGLREHLARERPALHLPALAEALESPDGAEKLLLTTSVGRVESVLIPLPRSAASRARSQATQAPSSRRDLSRRPPRASGCLSSQVGCAVGCTFCASGLEGLARNLAPRDLIGQALELRRRAAARGLLLANLVVMGMGEPFHNLDALCVALENLTHPAGAGFGFNKVTVSTVGVARGIERLRQAGPSVNLALSLHAPDDDLRRELVPLAARLPGVAELCALGGAYARETRRQVTLSYVLLAGVNDAPAQARALAALASPHGLHVNLIPVNEVEELGYRPPSRARVSSFVSALLAAKVPTHVRATRGAESQAACGQLRRRPRSAT